MFELLVPKYSLSIPEAVRVWRGRCLQCFLNRIAIVQPLNRLLISPNQGSNVSRSKIVSATSFIIISKSISNALQNWKIKLISQKIVSFPELNLAVRKGRGWCEAQNWPQSPLQSNKTSELSPPWHLVWVWTWRWRHMRWWDDDNRTTNSHQLSLRTIQVNTVKVSIEKLSVQRSWLEQSPGGATQWGYWATTVFV